ncbi:MAG: hypothetical protein QXG86_03485 [Candidatus Woesearchaeota archaeon]
MVIYFVILIVLLSFLSIYTDIKYSKISNRVITLFSVIGVVSYALFFICGKIDGGYLKKILINVGGTFLIGLILWYYNILSAGDAKLFFVFSLLIPSHIYKNSVFSHLGALDLFINTFIIAFIFVLIEYFFIEKKKVNFSNIKKIKPKDIGISLLAVFSYSWLATLLLDKFGIETDTILIILCVYFLNLLINNILKESTIYFLFVVAILRVFVDYQNFFLFNFLYKFLLISGGYILLSNFFSLIFSDSFIREVKIRDLKPGMVTIEGLYKKSKKMNDKNITKKIINNCILKPKMCISILDIERINKITNKKIKNKKIKVISAIKFAPFICIGALITLIAKGNLILFIKNYF